MPRSTQSDLALLAALSTADRARLIEANLKSADGRRWRQKAATAILDWIPTETLVPESAERWRPLVRDAFRFLFSHLSASRLAVKIVEQLELPDTSPEKRLIHLIARMPGLQKIGQVLARNRQLSPALRTALTELENGMSDVSGGLVREIIYQELGERLAKYSVRIADSVLSEASVSAVIPFSWQRAGRERERGVFKVLKPHVPGFFAEDMSLLQALGRFLSSERSGYGFAARDVNEMLTEVRLLLAHELDFLREQSNLAEAAKTYRATIGLRVPRVIPCLCTSKVTAMSEESGIKVTEACPRRSLRRARIANQLVDALIAVPLFGGRDTSIFHADPHAGNLLYDESNRELIVLDWALAEGLQRKHRRALIMLALMMILRNEAGVCAAIRALRLRGPAKRIEPAVAAFFQEDPCRDMGILEAMHLLEQIAVQGVHFAAPLFLFRKSLFTLDGVLQDVAGAPVRMDTAIVRYFLTRWAGSFGMLHSPLELKDFATLEWNALLYPARKWGRHRGDVG